MIFFPSDCPKYYEHLKQKVLENSSVFQIECFYYSGKQKDKPFSLY